MLVAARDVAAVRSPMGGAAPRLLCTERGDGALRAALGPLYRALAVFRLTPAGLIAGDR